MEENQLNPQETENQEITLNEQVLPEEVEISQSEIAEIENTIVEEEVVLPEFKFRHPQQVLNNKDIQYILSKKEEQLTDQEKSAISLYLLRARHHNSKPLVMSAKKRTALKKKRKASRASRKTNR